MGAKDDIKPLRSLALSAIAELLNTDEDHLPAGVSGVLANYGVACHEAGKRSAYLEDTNPGRRKTDKRLSTARRRAANDAPPPSFPDEETTRTMRPVRRTPTGAWTNDDDDQR